MFAPGTLHFDEHHYTPLIKGSTFNPVINVTNVDKTPMVFTGYTAKLQVRDNYNSSSVILECTTENSRITLTDGIISINVSATDTALLPVGEFLYDLKLVQGTTVITLLEGMFVIVGRITV